MNLLPSARPRAANALVLTLGVAVVVAGMIIATTDSGVASVRSAQVQAKQPEVMSALETVLRRREAMVVEAAGQGGPGLVRRFDPRFVDAAVFPGESNYGVDYVGAVQVRWRIEPLATRSKDGLGNAINWIQNPPPDPASAPTLATGEKDNPVVYVFRIAAEARLNSNGEILARAQGARYAAVNLEPLFRYVIFYAKEGPAGDLELSHADPVTIAGSVHSNGSIYMGGGLRVNDKIARLGPLNSSLQPSSTTIGPDSSGRTVAVTCADGVFRLNKSLMYAIVNDYPLTSDVSSSAGSNPTGISWLKNDAVDLSLVPPTNIHYPEGPADAIANVTRNGTLISPWRVTSISGAVTLGAQGSGAGLAYSALDQRQVINAVKIRGLNQDSAADSKANDSRQPDWVTVSPENAAPGFNGRVKDIVTGGRVIRLPPLLQNRALEPQQLENIDQPQEHQRPKFIQGGTTTYTFPSGNPVIEAAGQYLRYGLGQSDMHFTRKSSGDGWYLASSTGVDSNGTQMASKAGLIIRERMIPDTSLWPGVGSSGTLVPSGHPRYLPYEYGKHWYPTSYPFTNVDISDAIHQRMRGSTSYPGSAWLNHGTSSTLRRQYYDSVLGSIVLTAACAPGPRRNDDTSTTSTSGFANWGTNWNWTTTAPLTTAARAALYATAGGSPSPRKPYFYADNWRFVHLRAATAATIAGWKVTQFSDQNRPTPADTYSSVSNETYHSLVGQASASSSVAIAGGVSAAHGSSLTTITPATNYASYRWEAMLVPARTDTYTFSVSGTGFYRVFVDGELVKDAWFNTAASNPPLNAPVVASKSLTAGSTVAVVVEAYKNTTTPTLTLNWQASGWASTAIIPTAPAANPADGGKMYRRSEGVGFERSKFTAVQCLIRNPSSSTQTPAAKYGLMIRDGSSGLSPLMSGADRYLMVGWSPNRGIFTQRRLERAWQSEHTLGNQFYIGAGSGPSGPADATGVVFDDSTSIAAVTRSATLAEIVASRTAVQTGAVSYPTQTTTGTTTWTATTTPVSVPDLDLGGGKTWTFAGSIVKGTYVGTRTQRIDKRRQQTVYQIALYQLNSAVAGFIDADRSNSRAIRIFTNATGTTIYASASADNQQFNTSTAYTTLASTPPNANSWYVYATTTAPWSQLRRRYDYTRYSPSWTTGTNANQTSSVAGGATTLWYSGSAPVITKIGVPGTATLADINTMTGGAYTALLQLPTVSAPSVSWTPAPVAPLDAATAAITDTTVPTLPDFSTGRTLQIQRAGSTVQFDLNSYISRSGTWFNAAVDQYAPWLAAWGAITTTVGNTGGFRPDFYRGPSAPAVAITTSENNTGLATWQNGTTPWTMGDDVSVGGTSQVWLRIERNAGTGTFSLRYYSGALAAPTASDFTTITGMSAITLPSNWSNELLIGPCLQSGDAQTAATAEFANLRIETSEAADGVIDASDWNSAVPADAINRYMASQYQVFMGGADISEDFFNWRPSSSATAGCASEDWFYQPREFWSQSRWWDHRTAAAPNTLIDKDSGTFTDYTNRTLLAKTTVLTLNLDLVQDYFRNRTVTQATSRPLSNPSAVAVITNAAMLKSRFNGLIYAHRSNRYPWNPATDPDLGTPAANNPWSPSATMLLPNSAVNNVERVANGIDLSTWTGSTMTHQGIHKLQPYPLSQAPACKPQYFHHGVRIARCSNIDWGYADKGTQSGNVITHATLPTFGETKLSVVTPNHLYIQGDLNTVSHSVSANSSNPNKVAPMAIMGDSITLLSNNWNKDPTDATVVVGDLKYQADGLTVTNVAGSTSVSGAGTLAAATLGTPATSTSYNAAIVTHNIPTTKARVAEGQAAPFIDAMQFLENWNGATMNYSGSLVVLDSRRYTDAFLLDAAKKYGRTPFGTASPATWTAIHGIADWLGQSPVIYSEPIRSYSFNDDFLTAQGTPPFAPFGMTLDGIGSWSKVIP